MDAQNRRRFVKGMGAAVAAAAAGSLSLAVLAGVPFGRPYQSPFSVR